MKFCKDCKHIVDAASPTFQKCGRTGKTTVDLVTGREYIAYSYCCTQRNNLVPDHCGSEGKYFEPADGTPEMISTEAA